MLTWKRNTCTVRNAIIISANSEKHDMYILPYFFLCIQFNSMHNIISLNMQQVYVYVNVCICSVNKDISLSINLGVYNDHDDDVNGGGHGKKKG